MVAKLTREGSNLISRDTAPGNAALALKGMATRPVNFDIKLEGDFLSGDERRDDGDDQLWQGHPLPALRVWIWSGASVLTTAGSGSFGPGPDTSQQRRWRRESPGHESAGRLIVSNDAMVYITEIYTRTR